MPVDRAKPRKKDRREPTVAIDFVGGALGYRMRHGGARGSALAKAVGLSKGQILTVIDATAGLGRDAFLLASLGANVTLIERSPRVHALLQDALVKAAAAGPELAAIAARMTLIQGDARDLLRGMQADVILVDPMHPERDSSALVKQEMRLLRDLVGPDADSLELMQAALAAARNRVVLKWPRYAAALAGLPKPSHQFMGKTVRYDVFMTAR
jgi:16S rRNA (guanine1516-N2)-methyltransferase